MSAGRKLRLLLAAAIAAAAMPARAQDVPQVVSPLRVETDHNNVNLVNGKTSFEPPALAAPGAPRLRFDRVQNSAPYVSGRITGAETGTFSVHIGAAASESFNCSEAGCESVTGSGSTFNMARYFRQAGTGALWHFNLKHFDTIGPPRVLQYYAAQAIYPDGETISYSYETGTLPGDPLNRTFRRPIRIASNRGYFIDVTYHPGAVGTTGWNSPASATLYAGVPPVPPALPATPPLGRLTYSADGLTIVQYGENNQNPRTYSCTGCANMLGQEVETVAGALQLPGEGSPTVQSAAVPGLPLVQTVTRDGVAWTYAYTYQGGPATQFPGSSNYRYDRIDIAGPNGFNRAYRFTSFEQSNVLSSVTDSLGRLTSYQFDPAFRPTRITSPEGNRVDVLYDGAGNVIQRTATPKAGSGLSPIVESATYPIPLDAHLCDVVCWRPTWSRDGMGRQTDYLYNAQGQLTQQTDPADASGVRRRTTISYALSAGGISRRSEVRICGIGTTCGTNQEIVTQYQYLGDTSLPTLERRIDLATAQQLDTVYAYDAAGRLTMTDGPLAGTNDAVYSRYDPYGRKTWEIGALGANGVRLATRTTYRDSDDKPIAVESGTLPDQNSTTLTVLSRTDTVYDARRNPERETLSSGGTAYTLVQRTFDQSNRLDCEARRMNPAAFASLPASACTLGTQGSQGPDRIARNIWDAEGQLTQEQRAYGTALQQNYATYTYSPNGKRLSVTDANGNRAEMTYDGLDRQRRWIFPSPTTPGQANAADYEEYGYDAAGNRISLRKRDGSTLTYSYDNLNRMTVKVVPERAGLPVTHTRDVYYGYDLRNQQLFARFDSASGEGVTNVYDAFGRLASTTANMDGVSRQLSYLYDVAGRRERLTHPDGTAITYAHDAANRQTGIYYGIGTANPLALWSYDPRGLPISRPQGGGASVAWGYDAIGRLNSLTHAFVGGTGNVGTTFAYNPASQVTTLTRSNDAYAQTAPANGTQSYTVNGRNQYTAVAGVAHAYDANGNLTSDGATTFLYDVENRLVSASGAKNATLRYDPLGRLYEVASASATRRFLYDGDALMSEYDAAGAMMERYVHADDAGVDDPLVWFDGLALRWLHPDHQGSIVAVTNGSGQHYATNAYDAWGVPNAANVGRFQYTGQMWLAELGLYHYKARVYSPYLGRFLQTDPVGYDDQVNLYAYVGNDPVNQADSSGMSCDTGSLLGESSQCRLHMDYEETSDDSSRSRRNTPLGRASQFAADYNPINVILSALTLFDRSPGEIGRDIDSFLQAPLTNGAGVMAAFPVGRAGTGTLRSSAAALERIGSRAGFASSRSFGRAVLWGGGRNAAAQARIATPYINRMVVAHMRRLGVTRELVLGWRNHYSRAAALGRGPDVAVARKELLEAILRNW